jgi:enediyne biosynthesis thioesterase
MEWENLVHDAERKWYQYRHLVTFGDTNIVSNVYFANYFHWQGACRESLMAETYPEFEDDLRRGFGLITEFAHIDFLQESRLFDRVLVRMTVSDVSRTRIEFEFEFVREKDDTLLAQGKQAVVWVNQQHRPSLMPDKLYDSVVSYFDVLEK